MLLTAQIALGIWGGGLFLIGTVWGFVAVAEQVSYNRRRGYPWYKTAW